MSERGDGLVPAIGAFKLVKAAVLLAVGVVALAEPPERLAVGIVRSVAWAGTFPGGHTLDELAGRLLRLEQDGKGARLTAAALVYAAVFLVEGVGLLARRRWAEWLTVAVTASFVPVEIYELARRPGPGKVAALVINAAIVAYLVWRRVRDRHAAPAPALARA